MLASQFYMLLHVLIYVSVQLIYLFTFKVLDYVEIT